MKYNQHNKGKHDTHDMSLFYLLFSMVGIVPLIAGVMLAIILSPKLLVLFIVLEALNLTINWYRGKNTLDYYANFYAMLLIGIVLGKALVTTYCITPVILL